MSAAPALALLHGGGQGSWVWEETIAALGLQSGGAAHTLALDVPGCGAKRGRGTEALTMTDIADELAGDIAAWDRGPVTLVAHSQGGTVTPMIAERHPALVAELVYVSCPAPLAHETAMSWRDSMPPADSRLDDHPPGSRARYAGLFCNDMRADEAERFLDRLGADRWPAASYAADGWRYDHLAGLPQRYVLCLRDAVLPPAWQALFSERLGARTIQLDAAHQAMNTRPHALAELLLVDRH